MFFDEINKQEETEMALFNAKGLSEKLEGMKEKVSGAITDAKLDEKFDKVKQQMGDGIAEMKKSYEEDKAESNAAKAPLEGAIIRYQVIYVGGFPNKPQKKTDSLSLGLNVMEDSFVFKPENMARKQWFGDENFVVPYEKVTKFEIVKRQVSTAEFMLSSNGDTKSLEQLNNINISYLDNEGDEQMVRVEMLTGTTVYAQAAKCQELVDLLREKKILGKLNRESKPSSDTDVLAQIEKLASLKEKGLISEEEFAQKKAVLLEKL